MSEDFARTYRNTYASIYGRVPEPADGIAEHGLTAAEQQLGSKLPAALRTFYATVGGASSVASTQNRLVSPDELRLEDGSVLFCDENQSVCDWWIRLDAGDDPTVEQRMDGSAYDVGACSAFLRYFVYMQALFGGLDYGGARDEDSGVLGTVMEEWECACDHEGLAIYQKQGMLVGRMDGSLFLFCAARTEEDRAWLVEHFGFKF